MQEGDEVLFTIHREGTGSDMTTVELSTVSRNSTNSQTASSAEDYEAIVNKTLSFLPGELDIDVLLNIKDDDVPENNETFFIEVSKKNKSYQKSCLIFARIQIFNAKSDYVVYGLTEVEIEIEENDDSGGIFSFQNISQPLQLVEGVSFNFTFVFKNNLNIDEVVQIYYSFSLRRERGAFGRVGVRWKIISDNSSQLSEV